MKNKEPLTEEAQYQFGEALDSVLSLILKRADEEREQSESWKALHLAASEKGLKGVLEKAESQMMQIVMETSDVLSKKFGIPVSNKLYGLIKALPFVMNTLQEEIKQKQGLFECRGKAKEAFYKEVLEEIRSLIEKKTND